MRDEIGRYGFGEPYGLKEALKDLEWLNERRKKARGLAKVRLDDSILAQQQVIYGLMKALKNRTGDK